MAKNRYFIEFFGVLWHTKFNDSQGNYEDEGLRCV